VGLIRTDVSVEGGASIFRVDRIRELGKLEVISTLNHSAKKHYERRGQMKEVD
jgi:hypothetical protein